MKFLNKVGDRSAAGHFLSPNKVSTTGNLIDVCVRWTPWNPKTAHAMTRILVAF